MAGEKTDNVVGKDDAEKGASKQERVATIAQEVWGRGTSAVREAAKTVKDTEWMPILHLDGRAESAAVERTKPAEKQAGRGVDSLPTTDEGNLVRSLNQMAQNAVLHAKASLRGANITQESLGTALLIDEHGPATRNFFNDSERQAVRTLFEKWSRLDIRQLSGDDLAKFTDSKIAAAMGGAAAQVGKQIQTGQQDGDKPKQQSGAKDAAADNTDKPQNPPQADQGAEVVKKLLELLKNTEQTKDGEKPAAAAAAKPDVAPLGTSDFAARAQAVFGKIDTDGDGILTDSELAGGMEDQQFKGQDAQVIAALYEARGKLKGLSDDQFFGESGITISDLVKFQEIDSKRIQEYGPAATAKDWLSDDANFRRVDADGNGHLSKDELERSLQRPDLQPQEKDTVSYLLRNLDPVQGASDDEWGFENDGITRADLKEHVNHILSNSSEAEIIGKVAGVIYRTSESQKANANYNLYGTENPADSIKPSAIRQGMIGDCYFLCSLAAVAKTNPELIAGMIKDNKDGTYTVTFPGAKDEPITVKAPTEAEAGLYNGVGPEGTWALVMEKAYGKYCQQSVFRRSPFNLGGGNTPAEGGDGGGRTAGAMALLTGKDTNTDSTMMTSQREMAKRMEAAVKDGRPITAGINKSLLPTFLGGSDNTEDHFPRGHAYSVVGFTPDGKGGGTVVIRNPWGGADGTTGGTIEITMEQFMKNFSDVTIQS